MTASPPENRVTNRFFLLLEELDLGRSLNCPRPGARRDDCLRRSTCVGRQTARIYCSRSAGGDIGGKLPGATDRDAWRALISEFQYRKLIQSETRVASGDNRFAASAFFRVVAYNRVHALHD